MENIKTLASGLQYSRDWECEGSVIMHNPKTIIRYLELEQEKYKMDCYKYDCFFAFSNEQFEAGLKRIRPLKDGEKVLKFSAGLFGTKDGLDKFFAAHEEINKRIKDECDPQEVYFYEYNNHECMISFDGDKPAIELIESIFGKDIAARVIRLL